MDRAERKRRDNALYRVRKKGFRADTRGRTVYVCGDLADGRWREVRQIRTLVDCYGFGVQLEFVMVF